MRGWEERQPSTLETFATILHRVLCAYRCILPSPFRARCTLLEKNGIFLPYIESIWPSIISRRVKSIIFAF